MRLAEIDSRHRNERLDEGWFLAMAAMDIAAGVGKIGSAIASSMGADTEWFDKKLNWFIDNLTITGMVKELIKSGVDEDTAKRAAVAVDEKGGSEEEKKKALAALLVGAQKKPEAVSAALNKNEQNAYLKAKKQKEQQQGDGIDPAVAQILRTL